MSGNLRTFGFQYIPKTAFVFPDRVVRMLLIEVGAMPLLPTQQALLSTQQAPLRSKPYCLRIKLYCLHRYLYCLHRKLYCPHRKVYCLRSKLSSLSGTQTKLYRLHSKLFRCLCSSKLHCSLATHHRFSAVYVRAIYVTNPPSPTHTFGVERRAGDVAASSRP